MNDFFGENSAKGPLNRIKRAFAIREPSRLVVSVIIACLIYLAYIIVPWVWVSFMWSVCMLHWMGEYTVVFQKQNKLV